MVGIFFNAVPARAVTSLKYVETDRDAYVDSGNPTTNYGTGSICLAGNYSDYSKAMMATYIHFPLLSTWSTTNLQKIELLIPYLNVYGASFSADVRDITYKDFGESLITWNTQPTTILPPLVASPYLTLGASGNITIDITTYASEIFGYGMTFCVNSSVALAPGWMEIVARENPGTTTGKAALRFTYTVISEPSGIAGYDVMFLVLPVVGMLFVLGRRIRSHARCE